MINIGTLLATLQIRDQLTPALAKVQQTLKNTGPKMAAVGKTLSQGVTLPLVAAGAAALAAGDTIEKALRTISVATGATGQALEGLSESFTAVFRNVPQDADVVARQFWTVSSVFHRKQGVHSEI
jgi:phage-related minor tail protein